MFPTNITLVNIG